MALGCGDDVEPSGTANAGNAGAGGSGASTTGGSAGDTGGGGADATGGGNAGLGGAAGSDLGGAGGEVDDAGAGDLGGSAGDLGGSGGGDAGTAGDGPDGGLDGGAAGAPATPLCGLTDQDVEGDVNWTPSEVPCGTLGDFDPHHGTLLDVGHASTVSFAARTLDRLLSVDSSGRWVLWDHEERSMLLGGKTLAATSGTALPSRPSLAGDRFAVKNQTSPGVFVLELRSLADGGLLTVPDVAGLTATSPFGLSADGSYVWAATGTELAAFDAAGQKIASRAGNYLTAKIFGAPAELRVAQGPEGASVIEKIAIGTSASTTTTAFQGTFHSWFLDGARFLTTASTTVRVYAQDVSDAPLIVALPTVSQLTGQGDYFWTHAPDLEGRPLAIYSVPEGGALAQSIPLGISDKVIPSGNVIGVLELDGGAQIIELTAIGIEVSSFTLPLPNNEAFAGSDATQWTVGGRDGVLFDSAQPSQSLSCGNVLSIAGAQDGTTAVATRGGEILLFRLTTGTREYLGNIPLLSSQVALAADGSSLAAAGFQGTQSTPDHSLRVYDLSAIEELETLEDLEPTKVWPYGPSFRSFTISADGNRFGHVVNEGAEYVRTVLDIDDNVYLTLTAGGTASEPLALSPDGSRVAAPSSWREDENAVTNIYENGVLVDATPGAAFAWLDASRVLIAHPLTVSVYDMTDHSTRLTALPPSLYHQVIAPDLIYVRQGVYSLNPDQPIWACARYPIYGGVAGDYVTFLRNERLLFDRFRELP